MSPRPKILTIAGSDSGGGAGIQADLKTFAAHGAYGMSVVTAVTAQNTREVTAVHRVPPEVVRAQMEAVFEDLPPDAVKIGMLADREIVETVAAGWSRHLGRLRERSAAAPPVVLDPVMVAKSGARLLADDAVEALLGVLLPLATVVTPNLPEAAAMAGRELAADASETDRLALAREIARRGPAVLLKGGHAEEAGGRVVDLLVVPDTFPEVPDASENDANSLKVRGSAEVPDAFPGAVHRFEHARIATRSTHGTGCTLSSAIAARLGAGETLPVAVAGAIEYLHGAIRAAQEAPPVGSGHGPVDHLYRQTKGE